mmetsp:Transcript_72459/g.225068  ORF Transcript_72459/g.225068 Transcript_72459/m.225068 type:complete len:149 (+) Transcript_72459:100-546(+)
MAGRAAALAVALALLACGPQGVSAAREHLAVHSAAGDESAARAMAPTACATTCCTSRNQATDPGKECSDGPTCGDFFESLNVLTQEQRSLGQPLVDYTHCTQNIKQCAHYQTIKPFPRGRCPQMCWVGTQKEHDMFQMVSAYWPEECS